MGIDIPATVAAIEGLAARMRVTYAESGRRADNDAAYEFGEAAQHLRAGGRRLAEETERVRVIAKSPVA